MAVSTGYGEIYYVSRFARVSTPGAFRRLSVEMT